MAQRKSKVAKAASIVKMVANRHEGKGKSEGLASYMPNLPIGEVFAGAGGYGATRLGAKLGNLPIQKRWPRLAHHSPPALAAVGFLILLWLTGKLPRKYEKYIMPILIGSGLAVLHEAIRTWTPGLGWLVGVDRQLPAYAAPSMVRPSAPMGPLPAIEYDDESNDEGEPNTDEDPDLHSGIFAVK